MRRRTRSPRASTESSRAVEHMGNPELLVGKWEGPEVVYPTFCDPEGGSSRGSFTARMLGGHFLLVDYQRERDWMICYRGHGILGWQEDSEQFALTWVDTRGSGLGSLAKGLWQDRELCLEEDTPSGLLRTICRIEGADVFSLWIEYYLGEDEWAPIMEGEYRRLRRG